MMNDNFYRSGGAPMAIRRIAEAFTDVDYGVAACMNDGLKEDLSWIPEGRFERFDLKTTKPIRVLKELRRFKQWFRAQQFDLVHCHHRRVSALLHLARVPVLYTGQLAFGSALWFRWFHPPNMTAVSPSVAANILETTGRTVLSCIDNPARFPDVPPPIDVEKVRNRAVCVARLDPVKGHAHLLSAWKLLLDRGHHYKLDLVGEGPLRLQLIAQVLRDGLQEAVRFLGFTADVPGGIAESLFAILVSEVEGKPIVALEAAALGRPTLLTAVPGSVDILPPTIALSNGIEYGDVKGLADAIEEWFENPDYVVQEGKTFFNYLKTSSDPTLIVGEYKKVYQQVIAGVRGASVASSSANATKLAVRGETN
jgi:glycosyltransferase involved in cell wall biosynthesis